MSFFDRFDWVVVMVPSSVKWLWHLLFDGSADSGLMNMFHIADVVQKKIQLQKVAKNVEQH